MTDNTNERIQSCDAALKVDFSQVTTIVAIRQTQPVDYRESLANLLLRQSRDMFGMRLAEKVYDSKGPTDYSKREIELLRGVIVSIEMAVPRQALKRVVGLPDEEDKDRVFEQ